MGDLYFLNNARTKNQYEEMVRLEAEGVCIFCPEHVERRGGKEVFLQNDTWWLMQNDYPYAGTRRHMLLVPKQHVVSMTELSPESQQGFWDILRRTAKAWGPDYFVLASRNGSPSGTGATIMHFHMQFIVADPNSEVPVAIYASSKPSKGPPSA
jgi:ATP adenylyltransferase